MSFKWLCFLALMGAMTTLAHAQVLEVDDMTGEAKPLCLSLPPRINAPATPRRSVPYQTAIDRAAQAYDLSPEFLIAIIQQESGFNPNIVSPRGAIGLMQLMPGTAAELGVDPHNPDSNIMGGAAYLRKQLNRFDGRIDLALAAYNAGAGAVNRHGGVPPYLETRRYIDKNLDSLAKGVTNDEVSASARIEPALPETNCA